MTRKIVLLGTLMTAIGMVGFGVQQATEGFAEPLGAIVAFSFFCGPILLVAAASPSITSKLRMNAVTSHRKWLTVSAAGFLIIYVLDVIYPHPSDRMFFFIFLPVIIIAIISAIAGLALLISRRHTR